MGMTLTGVRLLECTLEILRKHHDYSSSCKNTEELNGSLALRDKGALEPINSSDRCLAGLLSNVQLVDEEELLRDQFSVMQLDCESDRKLIRDIVLGCVRWKKLLNLTLKAFFVETGCRYLKADYNLFAVLFYLFIFKLSEFPPKALAEVLAAQDATKMYKMLQFLFDKTHMRETLRPIWISMLDESFTDETLIKPIMEMRVHAEDHLKRLRQRVQSGEQEQSSKKKLTEPVPFLLTKPHPRKLPEPVDRGSLVHTALPVPQSADKPSVDLLVLAEKHAKNYQAAVEGQREAEKSLFKVAKVPRFSQKTLEKLEKFSKDKEALFNTFKAKPIMKDSPLKGGEGSSNAQGESEIVKINTATILREDALIRKEMEKKEQELRKVELGLRDATDYWKWKHELDEKERLESLLAQERRKLEVQILHEESILVKKRLDKANAAKGIQVKEESARFRLQIEDFEQRVQDENRKKIEDAQLSKDNVKIVKAKVEEENKKRALLIVQESEELQKQAKIQQKLELEKKMALIQQIREMERCLPPTGSVIKVLDLTETSNVGLMTEMSVMELQERLVLLKNEQLEQQQQRHESIQEYRNEKVKTLQEKLELIKAQRLTRGSRVNFQYQHSSANASVYKQASSERAPSTSFSFPENHSRDSSQSTVLSYQSMMPVITGDQVNDPLANCSPDSRANVNKSLQGRLDYDTIDKSLKLLQEKLKHKREARLKFKEKQKVKQRVEEQKEEDLNFPVDSAENGSKSLGTGFNLVIDV